MTTDRAHILIVEDTASLAFAYQAQLEHAGYQALIACSIADATELMRVRAFDAVLLDLHLPDGDGLDLLDAGRRIGSPNIIAITADGSIDRAVSAVQRGAFDFLVKPLSPERLLTTIRNAVSHGQLSSEMNRRRRANDRDRFCGFIGASRAIQAIYTAIENVAPSRATIFITGESGTGKEVAAEAIHASSGRGKAPFVAVNCGAIPEHLLESELFGHVKGAFTGATESRAGAVRQAQGGTLFLDEICEMELKLQVKLLRFLQTSMVQRVGSATPENVDVRVICATNRDPVREVTEGRFREDLFYRLSVIPLHLPPLRERGHDTELIARSFAARFAAEEGRKEPEFTDDALHFLRAHAWPGNVRELQNAIRRAIILGDGRALRRVDLGISTMAVRPAPSEPTELKIYDVPAVEAGGDDMSTWTLEQVERHFIEAAITRANGSLPKAAGRLGVSASTLYRKRERWMAA